MKKGTWWLVGGLTALALSLGSAVAWAWPEASPEAGVAGPRASYGANAGQAGLSATQPAAGAVVVSIEDFAYRPATLSVPVGTTVTWVNRDAVPHNVIASDRSFYSGLMRRDAVWSQTFTQPGTFSYVCTLHPGMVARVAVTAGTEGIPAPVSPVTPPAAEATPTPGQGDHCAGLTEDEMRKMMDSVHGQGSYDQMKKSMDNIMGPGWFDRMQRGGTSSGTSGWPGNWWDRGSMMNGYGGMGGMMGGYGGMGGIMGR